MSFQSFSVSCGKNRSRLIIVNLHNIAGGADYAALAPLHSYLEVPRDDRGRYDVAALAKTIKLLAGDRRRYAEYLWWKVHYEVSRNTLIKFSASREGIHQNCFPLLRGNCLTC
jgi:hypothetical protein